MGWVKLNTNGVRYKYDNTSCGGIIIGIDGQWLLGFSKYVGISSVYITELQGVLEGLKLVVAMDFRNIIMKVDYQQVVNDINADN